MKRLLLALSFLIGFTVLAYAEEYTFDISEIEKKPYHIGGYLLFVYAIRHCALIFVAGLSVGITESIVGSKGVRNFSIYSKKIKRSIACCRRHLSRDNQSMRKGEHER